ncbi:MAG: hypothetical protein FGM40_04390 [Rhodocyclaceae bacterium]|nr:hypothetical protein [Rhodocyclaceae bacterium]
MFNQQPPDLISHPEIIVITAIFLGLMLTVPPLMELRSRSRGLQRFNRWLEAGPEVPEAAAAVCCTLCGSKRLVTDTVATFPRKLRPRPIQCTSEGKIRFIQVRCGLCGTTVVRRREET